MTDRDFNIELAGEVFRIKAIYDCAFEFCRDYLTEKPESATITISQSDIDFERETGNKNDLDIPKDYPDSYLELLAIYRKVATVMPERDVLLIHGSAFSFDGNGILLLADSGVGKSTHASLWQKTFGGRVVMINDDKPLIKAGKDGAYIYGTPWSGKNGINTNTKAPLKVMCEIVRSETGRTYVEDTDDSERWKILTQQTFKGASAGSAAKTLELTDRLLENVPVKRVYCALNDVSAVEAYEGLKGLLDQSER